MTTFTLPGWISGVSDFPKLDEVTILHCPNEDDAKLPTRALTRLEMNIVLWGGCIIRNPNIKLGKFLGATKKRSDCLLGMDTCFFPARGLKERGTTASSKQSDNQMFPAQNPSLPSRQGLVSVWLPFPKPGCPRNDFLTFRYLGKSLLFTAPTQTLIEPNQKQTHVKR